MHSISANSDVSSTVSHRLQPVTLCCAKHVGADWFAVCVRSWHHLRHAEPARIISDGTIGPAEIETLKGLGLAVEADELSRNEQLVQERLGSYPALSRMRRECVMFRKLIDPAIVFAEMDRILYIDTDVLLRADCALRPHESDFSFSRDDISGYAGHWTLPLRVPLLLGLNGGFMAYAPRVVDLDFLEYLTRTFLSGLNAFNNWWAEQTCWAALGARASNPTLFDPCDSIIVNGAAGRTVQQILNNHVLLRPPKGSLDNLSELKPLIDQAAVIHFAGAGKRFIHEAPPLVSVGTTGPRELRRTEVKPAGFVDSTVLAARIGVRTWWKKRQHRRSVRKAAAERNAPISAS